MFKKGNKMADEVKKTYHEVELDFNRLDKLVRIDDPRMTMLDKDELWEAARVKHDRIKHLINGVDAKFIVNIPDAGDYILRPLSIMEELNCDTEAREDLNRLPAHSRTDAFRVARYKMRQLAKALSATPDSDSGLTLDQIGRMRQSVIAAIWQEWQDIMDLTNPNPDKLSQEQMNKIIEELEADASLVVKLSPTHSRVLLLYVLRINMLLTGKSRSGMPLDNETTEHNNS